MAISLRKIRVPRWTQPALLTRGTALRVVIKTPLSPRATLYLTADEQMVRLSTPIQTAVRDGLTACESLIPTDTPPRLYDLVLDDNGRRYVSPNAVAVLGSPSPTCTFLHTSDLHLIAPGGEGAPQDQSARAMALVAHINALRPAFVVHTGDLISRYGPRKEPLSTQLIEWQARRAQEILLGLHVPLFVTVGNHDRAFPSSRRAWRTYMGTAWAGPRDDHSFDYGAYHFSLVDCFVHYGPGQLPGPRSLTPAQCAWLQEDLRRAADCRWRFVFVHYDYLRQLDALLAGLHVDMLLYGHAGRQDHPVLEREGVRDGHLATGNAYRLVAVTANDISSTLVSWAELLAGKA